MSRLIGFIANRPDLCNRFAEYEQKVLHARREGEDTQWGWGIGFFQSGEILLKRRPLDDARELDTADMIADVRSDLLLAHIRRGTVGSFRTDNTHPFRYRQFMFADTGTVDGFREVRERMFETLPRFLQRGLRGDTDSELLFHLFLSFLYDAGHLDRPMVPAEDVFPALRSSLALLDRITKEAGQQASKLNILLATPEYLIAAHRGAPMAYRVLRGREDFEPLFDEEGPSKLRMPDLEPCRLAVVASDFASEGIPSGWTEVPDKAMIAFTRTDDPTIVESR
jgi:predicted glutamine amidotransferase